MKLGVNFLLLYNHLASPLEMRKYSPHHLCTKWIGSVRVWPAAIFVMVEWLYPNLGESDFVLHVLDSKRIKSAIDEKTTTSSLL